VIVKIPATWFWRGRAGYQGDIVVVVVVVIVIVATVVGVVRGIIVRRGLLEGDKNEETVEVQEPVRMTRITNAVP
jgi:hypothetical protein